MILNSYPLFLIVFLLLRWQFASQWWWLGLLNTFALWLFVPLLLLLPLAIVLRKTGIGILSLMLLVSAIWQFIPINLGAQSDQPHDLRVLTYNTWVLNPTIDTAIDWVLEQDADVIILQELVGAHLAQLPSILADYPHQVYVEGNVRVFSRYPLLERDVIWLVEPSNQSEGRLAVRAVVDVDGQPVAVYGVHISLPIGNIPNIPITTPIDSLNAILRYDETFRNQQLDALRTFAQSETIPVVIGGDFNTSHTSPALYSFSENLLQNSFAEVGQGFSNFTWYHQGFEFPVLWIDYLWSSDALTPVRSYYGASQGSDHIPVVSDFVFNPNHISNE